MKIRAILACIIMALAASCGGGDDDKPPATLRPASEVKLASAHMPGEKVQVAGMQVTVKEIKIQASDYHISIRVDNPTKEPQPSVGFWIPCKSGASMYPHNTSITESLPAGSYAEEADDPITLDDGCEPVGILYVRPVGTYEENGKYPAYRLN